MSPLFINGDVTVVLITPPANRVMAMIPNQIKRSQSTNRILLTGETMCKHELKMMMTDRKRGICGITPNIMNHIKGKLDKIWSLCPQSCSFDHPILNLDAYIRCLECCLHISY